MALKDELDAVTARMSLQFSDETKQYLMEGVEQMIKEENPGANAAREGDTAPDFSLKDQDGNEHSLSSLLEKGMLVVSFNRGNWCPYCVTEIVALQTSMSLMNMDEVNAVVIAPQTQELSCDLKSEHNLEMPILFDNKLEVAKLFGIDFIEPKRVSDFHHSIGVDFEKLHGYEGANELPIPALYVINRERKIVYSYINPMWDKRAEPEDYIAATKNS